MRIFLCLVSLCLVSLCLLYLEPAFADSTLNVNLVVKNKQVTATVQGNEASINYDNGNGLLNMQDGYPDFDNFDIITVGNQQGSQQRKYSLFTVKLIGKRFGRSFSLKGKLVGSKFMLDRTSGSGFSGFYSNNGCSSVYPSSNVYTDYFEIMASTDVNAECIATTFQKSFTYTPVIPLTGVYRRFVVNIGEIFKSVSYDDLPPDTYTGTVVYNGDGWVARAGAGPRQYFPNLTVNFSFVKKSFFSGVVVSDNKVPFLVKNINESDGYSVFGTASTYFNILGSFSDNDKVKIDVTSPNNYRLTSTGGAAIPYSVEIEYRGKNSVLVAQGNKKSSAIIEPGMLSTNLSGKLVFDFKTPANLVHNGMFTDNLTLVAELVL